MASLLGCRALGVRFLPARDAGLAGGEGPRLGRLAFFTLPERACSELTEQCSLEAKLVTDAQVERAREYLADAERSLRSPRDRDVQMTQRASIVLEIEPQPGRGAGRHWPRGAG